jgi:flavin-dependent dehydrogenase
MDFDLETLMIYDALVLGAGPAGAATALTLARGGRNVLLVERKAFPRRKVCGEYVSATSLPLLDRLGVGSVFRQLSGPDVNRVGVFAANAELQADIPRPKGGIGLGRALGRETLDTLMVEQVLRAGGTVMQPAEVDDLTRTEHGWTARVGTHFIETPIVVAANGSWDAGTLPKAPPRPSDLFGFKAHFHESDLPLGLMPLLCFPGGYGGMVHTDEGRVSISLCIRRDRLESLRAEQPGRAGEVVGEYVKECCLGVRHALEGARLHGSWLAVGPIRPGIRLSPVNGMFVVGNRAAEAHPVIAEGISMALQGGEVLGGLLNRWFREGQQRDKLPEVARQFARQWKTHFASRVAFSCFLAHWAMRRLTVSATIPLLRLVPAILTQAAAWSGKNQLVIPAELPASLQ